MHEAAATLILGRTGFVDQIREKYLGRKDKGRDMPALKELTKTPLEGMLKATQEEFRDKPGLARKAAIYLSHRYSGRSLREIGGSSASASRQYRRRAGGWNQP